MINAKLLQLVIDASHDGIVVAEHEGEDNILIYANPAFQRLTGYSSIETLYRDCRFLQNGERQDEAALTRIRLAIDNGQPCREILRNYRKDGTAFWNELSITPVYNESDKLTYYIGVQKDVSREVEAKERVTELERQLAAVRLELEHLKTTGGRG